MEPRIVRIGSPEYHGVAMVASDDSVWIVVQPPWWDIATRLWWWLAPTQQKAVVHLNTAKGKVRVRALCLATHHVRLSGSIPKENP